MLNAFKEIINPDVVLPICTGDNSLTVKECDEASKIKSLCINGVPENAFAFTLDYQKKGSKNRKFAQLSCYINSTNDKGINKSCDLVLLIPKPNDKWQILIFDLKSDKPKLSDTKKQLLNSEVFVRYLLNLVKTYYNIDIGSVSFKRAIVATADGTMRKSGTHRPIQKPIANKEYTIKPVRVSNQKSATVHLGSLLN